MPLVEKHFTLTPRVLSHLGEDLIKNENIAIVELVKNAYDAMASFCKVEFIFAGDRLNQIIIADDGEGMDLQTITEVWLVIGTPNKQNQLKGNERRRLPLGEKGIGRLGVHKLGQQIKMITHRASHKEVTVNIDWTQLDKVTDIDDFCVQVHEHETSKILTHGTIIEINKLKGDWTIRKLRSIYRELSSLESPFSNLSDSFKVIIDSNRDIFSNLPNVKEILDAAMYRGHCIIKDNQIREFRYEFRPWHSLNDIDGRTVCVIDETECKLKRVKESTSSHNLANASLEEFSLSKYNIGSITLDLYIFEKDSSVFSQIGIERTSVNQYLSENGGIRVYRDGIRIYNYGEKDDDWLSLDFNRLKRAGDNISNNIVVGAVALSRRDSADLREKTNREGFIENEAFYAFRDAVIYAVDIIKRLRNADKFRLISIYKKNKHTSIQPVLTDLDEIQFIIKTRIKDEQIQNDLLRLITRINSQYREVRDILIKSANAGLNLGAVVHELEKQVASLIALVRNDQFDKIEAIANNLESIISSSTLILRNSKIKTDSLSQLVCNVVDALRFRFYDHHIIVFTNRKSSDFKAMFSMSALAGALTNLLDNSIFWVCQSRNEDERYIYIYLTDQVEEGYVSVVVLDNGCGFKLSPDDAVEPFITGKPLNMGMGLGLHITNEVMKAMKGKLLILNKNDILIPNKAVEKGIDKAIVALCIPKA